MVTRGNPVGNGKKSIAELFPEIDLKTASSVTLADLVRKVPQLLPKKVRKDTASFYTAPWAADLLSELATTGLETKICDPACGAGNLLLSAVKILKRRGNVQHRLHVFGSDINPIGAEVTRIVLNTFLQETPEIKPEIEVDIMQGDAFHVAPEGARGSCDLVIMNPPFSSQLRISHQQKEALKTWVDTQGLGKFIDARMGLQFYFLFLADWYLKEQGTLALVIPATTFAGKAASKLLQFLQHQGYSFNYLVETASTKGAFSIDCCWKEFLIVAKKGEAPKTSSPQTRLIRLEEEPSQTEVEAIAQSIISGEEQLTRGGKFYGSSKLIPAEKIFAGEVMSESNPFLTDFFLHDFLVSRDALVPLWKSDEIGSFRGFDATYSRYLILPNEFLARPVVQEEKGSICFDVLEAIRKSSTISKLSIPLEFLRPCLRDPRSHDAIFEDTNRFWLLLVPPNAPKERLGLISDIYFKPLTGLIEDRMHQKALNGGKETPKSREKWFLHPWEYFSNTEEDVACKPGNLKGRVWTFNRYGLWRRQSIAICCHNPVTANHGCYTYYHKKPISKDLSENFWELLVAWFNSTLFLISMFEHAKIPAKHVQQVNLLELRQMLVPRFGRVLENRDCCTEITVAIHDLDRWLRAHREETLPAQMRACLENSTHPRIRLDRAWMKVIKGQENIDVQQLRPIYERIEKLLKLY